MRCPCGVNVNHKGNALSHSNRGYHATCTRRGCSWHLVHDDYDELTYFAEQHLKTHLDDTEAALQFVA